MRNDYHTVTTKCSIASHIRCIRWYMWFQFVKETLVGHKVMPYGCSVVNQFHYSYNNIAPEILGQC